MAESPVRELRLALTVEDYQGALAFYRDVLGLPMIESWEQPGGSGAILDAGRATLELLSAEQAELVDEVEVASGSPGRCESRSRSRTPSRRRRRWSQAARKRSPSRS